jgi:hypothetical protein
VQLLDSVCATPAGGVDVEVGTPTTQSASVRQSMAGVLAPTPGSNPTRSKRWLSGLS